MAIPNIDAILKSNIQIGGNAKETAVAKAYLVKHAAEFDRVEFNVGLGPGVQLGAGFLPAYQYAAQQSSKPRADMICYTQDTATIVEVKDRIYAAAMGQLINYWHILTTDRPKLHQVYKTVAGRTIMEGLPDLFRQYGIHVELFPDATPQPTA